MALHFQVYADFAYSQGRRFLAGTSLYSTRSACNPFPFWPYENTCLTISRIFPSLCQARSYLAFLHGVYKYPAPLPVLDNGQKELFKELSNVHTRNIVDE